MIVLKRPKNTSAKNGLTKKTMECTIRQNNGNNRLSKKYVKINGALEQPFLEVPLQNK